MGGTEGVREGGKKGLKSGDRRSMGSRGGKEVEGENERGPQGRQTSTLKSWSTSESPWNMARLQSNSTKMAPQAHTSTGGA